MADQDLRLYGPRQSRRCSDLLFLILFLAFAVALGFVLQMSIRDGNPALLLNGVDGDGKVCGIDHTDYKYLYYAIQVDSVTSAPQEEADLQDVITDAQDGIPELQEKKIDDVQVNGEEIMQKMNFTTLVSYMIQQSNLTPKWELRPVCVKACPSAEDSLVECQGWEKTEGKEGFDVSVCTELFQTTGKVGSHVGYGTDPLFGIFCLPDIEQLPVAIIDDLDLHNLVGSFGLDDIQQGLDDLVTAKWAYLYVAISGLFVVVLYNILIRYLAKLLIWLSVIGTGVLMVALALFLRDYHQKNYVDIDTNSETVGDVLQYTIYVLYGLTGLYFLMVLCLCKDIAVSVAVLKTAAVIVLRNMRVLLVPAVATVSIFAFIFGWGFGLCYLLSCANIVQPTDGTQLKTINMDGKDYLKWQIAVYVFGLFWVAELLSALFQYIMIVAVCTWYFSSTHDTRGNFSLFRGLWWSIRYNLGSLALGSFILAVIWVIRMIFEYVNAKMEKLKQNAAVACVVNCIRCCLDCCHRFIKFLNKNAYIQVALTGDNFCTSAMAAFALALKNSASFVITNGIGTLICFLGKLTISISNTLLGYFMLEYVLKLDINSPVIPLMVMFLLSYIMAAQVMSVYQITSLTILQCLYADVDICNQQQLDEYESRYRPKEMEEVVNMLKKSK